MKARERIDGGFETEEELGNRKNLILEQSSPRALGALKENHPRSCVLRGFFAGVADEREAQEHCPIGRTSNSSCE